MRASAESNGDEKGRRLQDEERLPGRLSPEGTKRIRERDRRCEPCAESAGVENRFDEGKVRALAFGRGESAGDYSGRPDEPKQQERLGLSCWDCWLGGMRLERQH